MKNSNIFIEGIEVEEKHMGEAVLYLPSHANKDESHPDCEVGFISTVNEHGIWARFYDGDSGAKCNPLELKWL